MTVDVTREGQLIEETLLYQPDIPLFDLQTPFPVLISHVSHFLNRRVFEFPARILLHNKFPILHTPHPDRFFF